MSKVSPLAGGDGGAGNTKWVPLFKVLVFFTCVSFSIIVPSIAPYLFRMGAPEWVLGVAVAIYSGGEMIGSVVFGYFSKRFCPRRLLVVTVGFGIVGSILYVAADVVGRLENHGNAAATCVILGRLLMGVWTGGKMTVEQSYIGEAAAPEMLTQLTSEVGVFAVLGFVVGPSIGALFAGVDTPLLPRGLGGAYLNLDQYTAPGYFVLVSCFFLLYVTSLFDPASGYARKPAANRFRAEEAGRRAYGAVSLEDDEEKEEEEARPPDPTGLGICLLCFFVHFYSFAIQETITTPYVSVAFGWSQRSVDTLFAGVSLLSLITSLALSWVTRCGVVSDVGLLVSSLLLGLVGSALLLDPPLAPELKPRRFLAGFALITVAFPLGRTVSLALFSKVLGPTPQGQWMGLIFVVGAIPRCLGPSWALYALRLGCHISTRKCPPGGATYLEFAVSGGLFLVSLAAVFLKRDSLKAHTSSDAGGKHRHPKTEEENLELKTTTVKKEEKQQDRFGR